MAPHRSECVSFRGWLLECSSGCGFPMLDGRPGVPLPNLRSGEFVSPPLLTLLVGSIRPFPPLRPGANASLLTYPPVAALSTTQQKSECRNPRLSLNGAPPGSPLRPSPRTPSVRLPHAASDKHLGFKAPPAFLVPLKGAHASPNQIALSPPPPSPPTPPINPRYGSPTLTVNSAASFPHPQPTRGPCLFPTAKFRPNPTITDPTTKLFS